MYAGRAEHRTHGRKIAVHVFIYLSVDPSAHPYIHTLSMSMHMEVCEQPYTHAVLLQR